jgi:hypothetical protein
MPERECKTKLVDIACPHQRKIVRANYPCHSDGRYLLTAEGNFDMELIQCTQDHGRCAETLCALHRFNRRGEGTWYPDTIRAMREGNQTPNRPTGQENDNKNDKSSFDQLY